MRPLQRTATLSSLTLIGAGLIAAPALAAVPSTAIWESAPNAAAKCHPTDSNYIGAADQKHNRIMILRQGVDWSCSNAIYWQKRLSGPFRNIHITDIKFRDFHGHRRILVSTGNGLAAIFAYPSGRRVWYAELPPSARAGDIAPNAHSIELLPSGAVAVADTHGRVCSDCTAGRVLYYPPGTTAPIQQIPFTHAHAVLYNSGRLWAAGGSTLNWYNIHASHLTKSSKSPGHSPFTTAHDLAPITDDPGAHDVWIAANGIYFYEHGSGRAQRWAAPAAHRTCVKSFGNERPNGRIVETWVPHNACKGGKHFLSNTVYLYNSRGTHQVKKVLKGSGFYKARPVYWSYY